MSPSQSPVHRAPYLVGSDTLEASSGGPPGASESGASISAKGDREEGSRIGRPSPGKGLRAGGHGAGERATGGLAEGLLLDQRLAAGV